MMKTKYGIKFEDGTIVIVTAANGKLGAQIRAAIKSQKSKYHSCWIVGGVLTPMEIDIAARAAK